MRQSRRATSYDPGTTRACNLWFRRPTPYPLGHRTSCESLGLVSNKARALPDRLHENPASGTRPQLLEYQSAALLIFTFLSELFLAGFSPVGYISKCPPVAE